MSPEGKKRVAQFLLALERQVAEQVLAHLAAEEQAVLHAEMAATSQPNPAAAAALFTAFSQDVEKALAEPGQGQDGQSPSIAARLAADLVLPASEPEGRLPKLAEVQPDRLAEVLMSEGPQAIACVLAHIEPKTAALVMGALPQQVHGEVVHRMAKLAVPTRFVLPALQEWIVERANSTEEPEAPPPPPPAPAAAAPAAEGAPAAPAPAPARPKKTPQHRLVARLLSSLDSATRDAALAQLAQADPQIAELIRGLMFLFDDLPKLDDRAAQAVIRALDNKVVALALKSADGPVKDKILQNVSKRAAEIIREELDMLGDCKPSDIERARRQIAETAIRLADEGAIKLPELEDEQ